MRFGSVCSGIEAASVAWEPLGWKAAWLAEIEPFPSAVLKHHYPDVPNLGDMTKLPGLIRSGQIEAPDLFCGGTPCQAFSVAGLRKSLDDARGNLSLTFCEIADAIDAARSVRGERPAIVFWENVPGVLSTKDNAFGCFLAGLAGEELPLLPPGGKWTNAGCVLGPKRSVAWRVTDAQYFGVAQRRRRVFVVASAREGFDPAAVLFEFDGLRRDTAPSREAGQRVAPTVTNGPPFSRTGNERVEAEAMVTYATPAIGSIRESDVASCLTKNSGGGGETQNAAFVAQVTSSPVLPFDTTQITSPANGNNPQYGDPCHPIAAGAHAPAIAFSRNDFGGDSQIDHTPTMRVAGNAGGMLAVALPINTQIATRHNCMGEGTGFGIGDDTDPAFTLTKGHSHAVACIGGLHPNAAIDVDRSPTITSAMGMGGWHIPAVATASHWDGDYPHPTLNQSAKGSGGVGSSNQEIFSQRGAYLAPAVAFGGDIARTLQARHDSSPCADRGMDVVASAMQVRRLTPVECERLQGFPDSYTAIPWRGKPADQCPDGPRYKALGNSWAVPNVRWIGERIKKAVTP